MLMEENLLFWLEVLSLKGELAVATTGIVRVKNVAKCQGQCEHLRFLHLASGLSDGRIQIWLVTTGEEGREALKDQVHTGSITALSFSEDGEWLISGSMDCMVRIWDWGKGKVIAGPFGGHK